VGVGRGAPLVRRTAQGTLPRLPDLSLSRRPVFDGQSRDAFEFPLVVGHEGEPGGAGVGGDPEIVVADRLRCPLQRRGMVP
jgi:hypothetical protein